MAVACWVIVCCFAGALVGAIVGIAAATGLALGVLAYACRSRRSDQSVGGAFLALLGPFWVVPLPGLMGALVGGVWAALWAFGNPEARFAPWVGPLFVGLGSLGFAPTVWMAAGILKERRCAERYAGSLSDRTRGCSPLATPSWAGCVLWPASLGLILYGVGRAGSGALWPLPVVALVLPGVLALVKVATGTVVRAREVGREHLADDSDLVLLNVRFLRVSDEEREQRMGFTEVWGTPEGELLLAVRHEPACTPACSSHRAAVLCSASGETADYRCEFARPAVDDLGRDTDEYSFPEFPRESPLLACVIQGGERELAPTAMFRFPNPDPAARAAGKRQGVLVRGRWVWSR